jgi:hypothetical protein
MESKSHRIQWLLISLLLPIPLLLNVVSMWQEYGQDALRGVYMVAGFPYNPWSDLIKFSLIIAIPLGLFAWLTISIAKRFISQNHLPLSKYVILLIITILSACISGIGTLFMDIQWSSTFRDGVGPGYTVSNFSNRNIILAFSVTVLVLFYAFWSLRKGSNL